MGTITRLRTLPNGKVLQLHPHASACIRLDRVAAYLLSLNPEKRIEG